MMQKSLRKKLLEKEKKQIVIISARELSQKILQIMRKYIGRNNLISQTEMFKRLFGSPSNYSDLQIWFMLDRMRKAMNWLRKTSYCFVVTKRTQHNTYSYFVVRDYNDAEIYVNHLEKVKGRINFMQKRCLKAVEEQFWKNF